MRTPGPLRAFGQRVAARRGRQVAIVAVARKLATIAWRLLTSGEDYAFASPGQVRLKLRRIELAAGAGVLAGPLADVEGEVGAFTVPLLPEPEPQPPRSSAVARPARMTRRMCRRNCGRCSRLDPSVITCPPIGCAQLALARRPLLLLTRRHGSLYTPAPTPG